MGFKWLCGCGQKNLYSGDKTKDAITTCPNCHVKQRIWNLKVVELKVVEPQKPQENHNKPHKTTIMHRPSKVSVPIDNINWLIVLEVMDRGISTIRNKPAIKKKKGSYYYDLLEWNAEFKKIEEIAKVMKLMGDNND